MALQTDTYNALDEILAHVPPVSAYNLWRQTGRALIEGAYIATEMESDERLTPGMRRFLSDAQPTDTLTMGPVIDVNPNDILSDGNLRHSSHIIAMNKSDEERTVQEGLLFAQGLEADAKNALVALNRIGCSPKSREYLLDFLDAAIDDPDKMRILAMIYPGLIGAADVADKESIRATVAELRKAGVAGKQVVEEPTKHIPESTPEIPIAQEAVRQYCIAELIRNTAFRMSKDGKLPSLGDVRSHIGKQHELLVYGTAPDGTSAKDLTDTKEFAAILAGYEGDKDHQDGQLFLEKFRELEAEVRIREIVYKSPTRRKFLLAHNINEDN